MTSTLVVSIHNPQIDLQKGDNNLALLNIQTECTKLTLVFNNFEALRAFVGLQVFSTGGIDGNITTVERLRQAQN